MYRLSWLAFAIVAWAMVPAVSVAQAPPSEIRISGLTAAEADTLRAEVARLAAARGVLTLLDEQARTLHSLQSRLGNLERADDPQIALLTSRARTSIDAGDLDSADHLLAEAAERDLAAVDIAEAQILRRRARAAAAIADRASLAGVVGQFTDAAALFGRAAEVAPADDRRAQWQYRLWQADALANQGENFVDQGALERARAVYATHALPLAPRTDRPLDWATTQNNLGAVLLTLAQRGDPMALRACIEAFQSALSVFSRTNAATEWAQAHNNLGNALRELAAQGDDTALTRSIAEYDAALLVRTRGSDPAAWAETQLNRGLTLGMIERRGNSAALAESVQAFEAALTIWTRQTTPNLWARAQGGLGLTLSSRRSDPVAMARSIDHFDAALSVIHREDDPNLWALLQNGLGLALWSQSNHGSNVSSLYLSVQALESSLEVWTREHDPNGWASTQVSLGMVLGDLYIYGRDDAAFDRAIQAFEAAQTIRTRERDTAGWANIQQSIDLLRTIASPRGVRQK